MDTLPESHAVLLLSNSLGRALSLLLKSLAPTAQSVLHQS